MKRIVLVTDYKGNFGTKYIAKPYRSGMDKRKLQEYFEANDYIVSFVNFSKIDFRDIQVHNCYYLYTSAEDWGRKYKGYIEDIIFGLSMRGANIIPAFEYLKSHENKVFMEILRNNIFSDKDGDPGSKTFGTIEEFLDGLDKLKEEAIVKIPEGSLSRGVFVAHTRNKLVRIVKKYCRSKFKLKELKDVGRRLKHPGYINESKYRNKFVVQNYIPALENDWKVLIYWDKYYVLKRYTKPGDFRASGSGLFEHDEKPPDGLLDFAKRLFEKSRTPNISFDIGFDGLRYYLFEFQAVYYGTYTIDYAKFYFINTSDGWEINYGKSELEAEYVRSNVKFIDTYF